MELYNSVPYDASEMKSIESFVLSRILNSSCSDYIITVTEVILNLILNLVNLIVQKVYFLTILFMVLIVFMLFYLYFLLLCYLMDLVQIYDFRNYNSIALSSFLAKFWIG